MTDNDYIGAVGTWFRSKGVKYSFRVVINDKQVHSQSGNSPFNGYSTIKLTKYIPVKKGDEVQIIFCSDAVPVQLNSRQHYQKDTSIYSVNGKNWYDLIYKNCTAILKVYTVDKSSISVNKRVCPESPLKIIVILLEIVFILVFEHEGGVDFFLQTV